MLDTPREMLVRSKNITVHIKARLGSKVSEKRFDERKKTKSISFIPDSFEDISTAQLLVNIYVNGELREFHYSIAEYDRDKTFTARSAGQFIQMIESLGYDLFDKSRDVLYREQYNKFLQDIYDYLKIEWTEKELLD